ncbi:hypothetical protein G6355_11955 [Vibrio cholerae]|uniref:endonuclease n=1 Tax=Vibrio cholerae TaxID=666 RepID=UPI002F2DA9F6
MKKSILISTLLSIVAFQSIASNPVSFETMKQTLRSQVYQDRNSGSGGELYCGCDWEWVGSSGGRINMQSCGYKTRSQPVRAERIEWEHVVPAHSLGHQRQCWQTGGRNNCAANDPIFQQMYVDPFNLTPVVGEVNADRSNYRFSPLSQAANQYGACRFKVDFKNREAEPADGAKGKIARIYMYMHHRYDLRMSAQQERIFMAWNTQFPVSDSEKLIHDRKARIAGHVNPFVTGDCQWQAGNKPICRSAQKKNQPHTENSPNNAEVVIRGNRNSKIYHLSHCASYNSMSERNIVEFRTELEAKNAGYRKAGNCN